MPGNRNVKPENGLMDRKSGRESQNNWKSILLKDSQEIRKSQNNWKSNLLKDRKATRKSQNNWAAFLLKDGQETRRKKAGLRGITAWVMLVVFVSMMVLAPLSALAQMQGDPGQMEAMIRADLQSRRAQIWREMESKGYEVSDATMDRYIDRFAREYMQGLVYVQNNSEKLTKALSDAVARGASQSELDALHQQMVGQLMAESGFNPDSIAANVFPRKPAVVVPEPKPEAKPAPAPEPPQELPGSSQPAGSGEAGTGTGTTPTPAAPGAPDASTGTGPGTTPAAPGAPSGAPAGTDPGSGAGASPSSPSPAPGGDLAEKAEEMIGTMRDNLYKLDPRQPTIGPREGTTAVERAIEEKAAEYRFNKRMREQISTPVDDGIFVGTLYRAVGIIKTPVTATLDGIDDFTLNMEEGDGVVLSATKATVSNVANGLTGLIGGTIDMGMFWLSKIPFVKNRIPAADKALDFGASVKGPINMYFDRLFHTEEMIKGRVERGYYAGIWDYAPTDTRANEPVNTYYISPLTPVGINR